MRTRWSAENPSVMRDAQPDKTSARHCPPQVRLANETAKSNHMNRMRTDWLPDRIGDLAEANFALIA